MGAQALRGIKSVIFCIILCWTVFVLQGVYPFVAYGIQPRTYEGLIGIVASPFLHANINHLLANTAGLVTFGLIFGLLERKNASSILITIILLQGTMTWIFARPGNHIGASGLVFGLFGYLMLAGLFKRHLIYLLVSCFIFFSYGSFIFGILPTEERISWEAHLFGFIAGGFSARAKG